MSIEHVEIDNLYKYLKIENENIIPRDTINRGNMNRKLNSDFSAVSGNSQHVTYSSSSGNLNLKKVDILEWQK